MISFFTSSCNIQSKQGNELNFSLVSGVESGIHFNNKIIESDSVNFFTNEYMYIGSGVGVGDFNNDGLQDIFFCGSQESSRLYLNKGNFKFEDVTQKAGVQTHEWCTGVSVIDINNDGLLDIYVCASHSVDPSKRKNLLFINNGVSPTGEVTFSEEAADYGLADTGFSTQAVFLDYDHDGDLDMYLLNHRLYYDRPNNLAPADTSGNSPAEDRLYRNDGFPRGKTHPVFTDVSKAAGIKEDGYGLGVVVTDINKDGWPDIYVANDYIGNDLLWLNNRNGTFTNCIAASMKHQSYNSMGVDAADINNDGRPDVAVLDMLPENNERKKMMYMPSSPERYDLERRLNYQPEFTRNMLQLNNGNRKAGNTSIPFFSEIGQLAGISETNWSWSVLLADFDNDGWKDMHVTNGLARDLTNNDFVNFRQSKEGMGYDFNNSASISVTAKTRKNILKELYSYGDVKTDNYLFLNNHSPGFTNITGSAGMAVPSISHGAAYVDLDNDGDLDLVINNMNQEAFLWKNNTRNTIKDSTHNFLTLQLKGAPSNVEGVGANVNLFVHGNVQYLEQNPVRGYSSSVDNRLHFGIDNAKKIDSLKITWPDKKFQVLYNVDVNKFITLDHKNAKDLQVVNSTQSPVFFSDILGKLNIDFKHNETPFFDFGYHRLLSQKYSQLGPCMATGDINGDGLTDFFIGGAAGQSGKLFFQRSDGTFISKNLIDAAKPEEDVGAILFDADGDKDLDLLITGGSTEFGAKSTNNSPRLYVNDGKGNFSLNKLALPAGTPVISQAVTVGDYDGDGDMDIFIGGRVVPENYPELPRSYILQNNKGIFTDVTKQICPALENPGMITAALFTDFNSDNKPDLIICGEWMPIRFFENRNGKFVEITGSTGLTADNGMWRSLQAIDIDNDGDIDYVAGNMGLNNKFHPTAERPMMLYAKDMDKNGSIDLIPAYYIKDNDGNYQLYPGTDRNQLADEIPGIKKKYLLHKDFSNITMEKLASDYGADGWTKLKCETMQSAWIENLGKGKFKMHALPLPAQFSPINTVLPLDVDGDGNIDLIVAGNEYQAEPVTGRYDASYGLVLKGNGKGNFKPFDYRKNWSYFRRRCKRFKKHNSCK